MTAAGDKTNGTGWQVCYADVGSDECGDCCDDEDGSLHAEVVMVWWWCGGDWFQSESDRTRDVV